MANTNNNNGGRSNRGFAAMDPNEQRAIARKGGEAVSQDREHMAAIGRKGGEASGGGNRGRNDNEQPRDSEGQFTSQRESSGQFNASRDSEGQFTSGRSGSTSRDSDGQFTSGRSGSLSSSRGGIPGTSSSSSRNGMSDGPRDSR